MEEDAGPTGPRPAGPALDRALPPGIPTPGVRLWPTRPGCVSSLRLAALVLLSLAGCAPPRPPDLLAHVRSTGRLVYGSDAEGGAPYAFPDPNHPRQIAGFEIELLRAVTRDLGVSPVFSQGQWDRLLQNLDAGHVDMVVNGYEWTETRTRDYLATRPYYVYQLQLLAPRLSPIGSWDDLKSSAPGRRRWKLGVLAESAADTYAATHGGPNVEVIQFPGATDAMLATAHGQVDATLQDLPAAQYYRDRFPTLRFAGAAVGHGYYVMYFRRGDETLRDAIDRGLARVIADGELRALYERYGLWNDAQNALASLTPDAFRASIVSGPRGLALVWHYAPVLLDASLMTLILSVTAMPLAMALGLMIALGRLYGPSALRMGLAAYVEFLRGTPLMLQLYVLFYVLRLEPMTAGILGLAVNYSAYEAEIYRAGLQAIPAGQMEAALALGMSRGLALRRVVLPQAVRIVVPPVTNDFIAMFKDTSVCSVVTLTELTKQYNMLANHTGGFVEFAVAASVLYLAMSVPLSWFSRWSEGRLGGSGAKGEASG